MLKATWLANNAVLELDHSPGLQPPRERLAAAFRHLRSFIPVSFPALLTVGPQIGSGLS